MPCFDENKLRKNKRNASYEQKSKKTIFLVFQIFLLKNSFIPRSGLINMGAWALSSFPGNAYECIGSTSCERFNAEFIAKSDAYLQVGATTQPCRTLLR